MRFMFDTDESFSFETLRAVGYTVYGGADIGEVMATAARITPGDWESWHREWRALADRIAGIADECAAKGHSVSASSAASPLARTSPISCDTCAEISAREATAGRASAASRCCVSKSCQYRMRILTPAFSLPAAPALRWPRPASGFRAFPRTHSRGTPRARLPYRGGPPME